MTNTRQQRVLLTGATGFVGSHLAERIVAEGWELHAVIRSGSDISHLDHVRDKVRLHQHDGTTAGMLKIVEDSAPDLVFHLASLFLSEHKPEDVERLITSNVLFSTQLMEALSKFGVKLLVNAGTSWQHYQGEEYSPVNLYAATKQAFESIVQYYVEAAGMKVVTLKLFDTYGPDDWRPKLFRLLRNVAESGAPLGMSPGEQFIDLVYIDDVNEAFMTAAKRLLNSKSGNNEHFAVSSGAPVRLRDLVELFSRALGREIPIEWGGRPYRAREVMDTWNGPVLPGWSPKISLAEGVKALAEDSNRYQQERG